MNKVYVSVTYGYTVSIYEQGICHHTYGYTGSIYE